MSLRRLLLTNEELAISSRSKLEADRSRKLSRINLLEEEVSRIQDEIAQEKQDVALYEALLSPIRHLPADILLETFGYIIPSGCTPSAERNLSLLQLCWVSSLWRRILTMTPSFWSSLHIPLLCTCTNSSPTVAPVGSLYKKQKALMKGWFQRARKAPLSLLVDLRHQRPYSSRCPTLCSRIIEKLIFPYGPRLEYLQFNGCNVSGEILLLYKAPFKWNCLKVIILRGLRFISSSPSDEPTNRPLYDKAFPQLLQATLVGHALTCQNANSTTVTEFPWTQLVHLSISKVKYNDWRHLLLHGSLHNISSGSFSFDIAPDTTPALPVSQSVILPNLTDLNLLFPTNMHLSILDGTKLPVLRRLHLASKHMDGSMLNHNTTISSLIRKVEDFSLSLLSLTDDKLKIVLDNMRDVKKLELGVVEPSDIFALFAPCDETATSSSSRPLSNLETLSIEVNPKSFIDLEKLRTFLNRMGACPNLPAIQLEPGDPSTGLVAFSALKQFTLRKVYPSAYQKSLIREVALSCALRKMQDEGFPIVFDSRLAVYDPFITLLQ